MSKEHEGGCLCGAIRFAVNHAPMWVTVCYCKFCQRATGSDYMVEPIFTVDNFRICQGAPRRYTHVSEGSGQHVYVHFCPDCASKLYVTFERWPDRLGVYAGAFDDPNWFQRAPGNTKHIFTSAAPRGAVLPAGYPLYDEHAATLDGVTLVPEILSEHCEIRG